MLSFGLLLWQEKGGDDSMSSVLNLKPGETGIIKSINIEGLARNRMIQLGVIEGEKIKVVKYAPLGDPIEITIKGYSLCFRKSEAEKIIII